MIQLTINISNNNKIGVNNMTLIYTTCKDKREAEKVSAHLLKKRLIACANMFPIKSMFWWNFKIANENEVAIFAKTNEKNFKEAVKEIRKMHSYKIPLILKISARANNDYEEWANKEMKS